MFVPSRPFHPRLNVCDKAEARLKPLSGPPLLGKLLAQTLNFVGKTTSDNHSSLLQTLANYEEKRFITSGPGVEPIKLFRHKFTHSFLKARSFHSNATKTACYKMVLLTKRCE